MKISNVYLQYPKYKNLNSPTENNNVVKNQNSNVKETVLPLGFNTSYNISFCAWSNPNRLVGDVDIENYYVMTEKTKERYRKLYKGFETNEEIDHSRLFDKNSKKLPLMSDETMEKFIKASKIYLDYKDQPIICLGRSPKWFLNTAFWMKDGVPDYNFVAFSKFWFIKDPDGNLRRMNHVAPSEEEEFAYRKYLNRIGASPQKIVNIMRATGKKTVITDYICSGKGICSFLDIMSRYAKDVGILEEFSKSIEIVGIGSMEYMENLHPYSEDEINMPEAPYPPLLEPYAENIKYRFYDIDYEVFNEMLLNRNTNECRSTYYPKEAWTVYSPDTFKTGLIKDMSKVEELLEIFKNEKYIITFSAPMQDYRNLVNFKILDYLHSKNMLREPTMFKLQNIQTRPEG